MQDRVPLYPGRVTLTPVSGNTYDMAMADQPQVTGTPLNKANLLSDAAAAAVWPVAADRPADPTVSQAFEHIGVRGRYLLADYTTTTTLSTPETITLADDFENYSSFECFIIAATDNKTMKLYIGNSADDDHFLCQITNANTSTATFVPGTYVSVVFNSSADGHLISSRPLTGAASSGDVFKASGSNALTGRNALIGKSSVTGPSAGVRIQIYGTRL